MKPEPFVSAREAAKFVGFEVNGGPVRKDPAMRAFYAWVTAARVPKHHRGERVLLFRLSELEAAITRSSEPSTGVGSDSLSMGAIDNLTRMERLARQHIRKAIDKKAG